MSGVNIESPGDGYQAKVDSLGRLHTKGFCSPHTVTTTLGNFNAATATMLVPPTPGCCSLTIQVVGNPMMVRFEDEDPVAGDFLIAAGGTFTLPFAYEGEVRGLGVGGGGTFAVIQGIQATS